MNFVLDVYRFDGRLSKYKQNFLTACRETFVYLRNISFVSTKFAENAAESDVKKYKDAFGQYANLFSEA